MITRRVFIFNSLLFASGCSSINKDCSDINNYDNRLDCIYNQMFPSVAKGAVIGFVAGAVLGGAIAFATRNPAGAGMVAGGVIGGIAGGVIAYYNFSLKRSGNNPDRALSDIYQDVRSDTVKINEFNNVTREYANKINIDNGNDKNILLDILGKINAMSEQYNSTSAIYSETSSKIKNELRTMNVYIEKISDQLEINNRKLIELSNYINDIRYNHI